MVSSIVQRRQTERQREGKSERERETERKKRENERKRKKESEREKEKERERERERGNQQVGFRETEGWRDEQRSNKSDACIGRQVNRLAYECVEVIG